MATVTTAYKMLTPLIKQGLRGFPGPNGTTSGVFIHSELTGLDYASAGHTGFQPSLSGTGFVKSTAGTITYDTSTYSITSHNHSGVYDVAGAAAAVTPTTLGLVIGTNVLAQRTFNDSNWDTAYSWGNPSGVYAPLASPTFTGTVTTPSLNVTKREQSASFGLIGSGADNYIHLVGTVNNFDIGVKSDGSFGIADAGVAYRFEITQAGNVSIPTGGLHIGGDSDAGDNNLLVDGTIKGESLESVTAFSSGFAGNGYKVIETGGISSLEVDKLIVRGILQAYELQINKISSVNGGMIISIANAKCTTVSGTTIYFDEGVGLTIPFVVNDYIKAQQFNGTGVAAYLGKVTAVNAGNIVATQIGAGAPWNGMDLVQFGNSNTGTYSARQNAIYLTAADTNNPYIAGYAGITDGLFAGHEKFRLGNLTGITDDTLSPSGFGLYAQNVFLSGKIVASAGAIGGWVIGSNYFQDATGTVGMSSKVTGGNDIRFWAGSSTPTLGPFIITKSGAMSATSGIIANWNLSTSALSTGAFDTSSTMYFGTSGLSLSDTFKVTSAGALTASSGTIGGFNITSTELYAGSGATRVEMQAAGGFWAGADAFADALFSVDPAGTLIAKGVAEIGTSISIYDGISNIAIKGADIWENSYNGDNSHLYINRLGYNGGTSYFRNLNIFDGKGTALLTVSGNTQSVMVNKDLQVYGNTSHIGNLTFSNGPKVFTVPIMTSSQKLGMTPVNGMIVYISDLGQFQKYAGGWLIM